MQAIFFLQHIKSNTKVAKIRPSIDIKITILPDRIFKPSIATFIAPKNPVPIVMVNILKVGERSLGSVKV